MTSAYRSLHATPAAAGEVLPADLDVPLLRGAQRQGDVLVLPERDQPEWLDLPNQAAAIPDEGVVVVRGEADGNPHLLLGDASWSPSETELELGVLYVATEAYLIHPEHAALGIAAGQYWLRRQREQTTTGPRLLVD